MVYIEFISQPSCFFTMASSICEWSMALAYLKEKHCEDSDVMLVLKLESLLGMGYFYRRELALVKDNRWGLRPQGRMPKPSQVLTFISLL